MPAVLGLVFPFHLYETDAVALVEASDKSVLVTLVAWVGYLLTLLAGANLDNPRSIPDQAYVERSSIVLYVLLLFCVGGFLYIALSEGSLLWALKARDAQYESYVRLLWRWINILGLLIAVILKRWTIALVFLIGVLCYFIAGDRTAIAIATVALVVASSEGRKAVISAFRPRYLLLASIAPLLIFFGKPIYLSIKEQNTMFLRIAFSEDWIYSSLASLEPFLTFNILDQVVLFDYEYPLDSLVLGVIGQILIVPSYFGIDSNSFNEDFTRTFSQGISYGIAGNFWAQGYSVAGYLGVMVFSFCFGATLIACDNYNRKSNPTTRAVIATIGALVAIYAHRNSLDNLLSFVRQILVVAIAAGALAAAARALLAVGINPTRPVKKRRPSNPYQTTDRQPSKVERHVLRR